MLVIIWMLTGCFAGNGRIVTVEYLSGYEGGDSLSTLWYKGTDEEFHYFTHFCKMSTPYRIRKSDLIWDNEFPRGSDNLNDRNNTLVRHQLSDYIKSKVEITNQ